MSVFIAAILAAIPNVLLAIGAKLFTEKFLQAVLEKVIIFSLKKASALTTNTVDDDLAAMVEQRLTDGGHNAP